MYYSTRTPGVEVPVATDNNHASGDSSLPPTEVNSPSHASFCTPTEVVGDAFSDDSSFRDTDVDDNSKHDPDAEVRSSGGHNEKDLC